MIHKTKLPKIKLSESSQPYEESKFQQPSRIARLMNHNNFVKGVFVLALISIVLAFYFFWQWNQLRKTPENRAQSQLEKTVQKISKLVELPTDETPTLAIVSNPDL